LVLKRKNGFKLKESAPYSGEQITEGSGPYSSE
jgi:hypothetical protein